MRFKKLIQVLCFILCMVTVLVPITHADDSKSRLSGDDRYKTAVDISKGGWQAAENVVLATGENFPDALCAAPLAMKLNAPILLTGKSALNSDTNAEIARLGAKNVFIIGGPGVIDDTVKSGLEASGKKVTRLFGSDRYETALNVAKYMVQNFKMSSEIAVAIGEDFPDALSISPIAASNGMIIVLTPKDNLPSSIKDFVAENKFTKSYVVGGNDIISDNVIDQLPGSERITGSDKYERNIAILNKFISKVNVETIYAATGNDYPDALAGSVLSAKSGSPIVLTDKQPKKVSKDFIAANISKNKAFKIFGGIGAMPETTANALITNSTVYTASVWESYKLNPDNHPNIPNNSYAGYKYGEQPIPNLPVVVNAAEYGALGDGVTDSTEAIKNALKAASEKGGGAVLLPVGTYAVSDVIYMKYDGVALRGEGQDKTVIKFTRSLNDCYGKSKTSAGHSIWLDTGGMIWFVKAENNPLGLRKTNTLSIARIISDSNRGDKQIEVNNTNGITNGQKVLIVYKYPKDYSLHKMMVGNVPGAGNFDWANKIPNSRLEWPVEVESISGQTLTLKQPLRLGIRKDWDCELVEIRPTVQNSGIEDLTLDMGIPKTYTYEHHSEEGYNGIFFQNSWDCWAKNITIKDSDSAVINAYSKCITAENISIEGKCYHHGFVMNSYDSLVTKFTISPDSKPFHGIDTGANLNPIANGNVYSNGIMHHGTFDYHRGMPYDTIITNITFNNDGQRGNNPNGAPMFGARVVHWNIRITNNRPNNVYTPNLMPYGAVVGVEGCTSVTDKETPDFEGNLYCIEEASGKDGKRVEPENLYEAQLKLRLGIE